MGNRAVITASTGYHSPCIYLHWNGGMDSVSAFMRAARAIGLSGTKASDFDALAEMIAECLDTAVGMTVYREMYGISDTDNGDNGVYVIDDTYNIVYRRYRRGPEQVNREQSEGIYQLIVNAHWLDDAAVLRV